MTMTMTITMMATTTMTTETNRGEGGIGCRRRLCQRRIWIRLKKTAIMISAAGVNNIFVDDIIVFVSVASVSPGTYPTTFT